MTLAQSIATDRQRLGLSQAELAARLGVSQQSVSKWEEGRSVPRGRRMQALMAALGQTSRTAALLQGILASPNSAKRSEEAVQVLPFSEIQALAALAKAAEDLARAAQAIAIAIERIAARPPPPPQP